MTRSNPNGPINLVPLNLELRVLRNLNQFLNSEEFPGASTGNEQKVKFREIGPNKPSPLNLISGSSTGILNSFNSGDSGSKSRNDRSKSEMDKITVNPGP